MTDTVAAAIPTGETLEALIARLVPQLEGAREEDIRSFVTHAVNLVDEPPNNAFRALVHRLFESSPSLTRLITALLECETASIRAIADHEVAARQQLGWIATCVQHYNELQAILVQEGETVWTRTIAGERKRRLLAEAKQHWLQEGAAELFNYFEGLPVRARVEVVDVGDEEIQAICTPETRLVFAASRDQSSAWVGLGDGLRLQLIGRSARGNRIFLSYGEPAHDRASERKHVRIRLRDPIPALVHLPGGHSVNAGIVDKSATGLGLLLENGASPLEAGMSVRCEWNKDGAKLSGQGQVIWSRTSEEGARAGIRLQADARIQAHFQRLLMQEQREIIARLKRAPLPEWMLPEKVNP